jgi:hypothetical protein
MFVVCATFEHYVSCQDMTGITEEGLNNGIQSMPTALTSMQAYDWPFMIKIRRRFASTSVAIVAGTLL